MLQRWLHGCETCQNVCPLNEAVAHRLDAVMPPELTLEGMMVPNLPSLSREIIESRMGSLISPGYQMYLERLLAAASPPPEIILTGDSTRRILDVSGSAAAEMNSSGVPSDKPDFWRGGDKPGGRANN